jgi:hypothetical protein
LLVASETGHVYTFATPKLQPLITKPEGKNLIQACLNAPDNLVDIGAGQSPSNSTGTLPTLSNNACASSGCNDYSQSGTYLATSSSHQHLNHSHHHIPPHHYSHLTAIYSSAASGASSGTASVPPDPYSAYLTPSNQSAQNSSNPSPNQNAPSYYSGTPYWPPSTNIQVVSNTGSNTISNVPSASNSSPSC